MKMKCLMYADDRNYYSNIELLSKKETIFTASNSILLSLSKGKKARNEHQYQK